MGYSEGSHGKLSVFEDFWAVPNLSFNAIRSTLGSEGVWYSGVGVSGATDASGAQMFGTVDETGGVIAIQNASNDNDNIILHIGPFQPLIGGCQMEARFKLLSPTAHAIFVGFAETSIVDATTPSMPVELATASLSGHSTGGAAGMLYDYDATTKDFFAVATDANTINSQVSSNGVDSGIAPVSDRWDIVRVEVDETGKATMSLAEHSGSLKVIKTVSGAVNPSDLFFAVIGLENRNDGVTTDKLEVDYFAARGFRDWNTT